ncbi:MAG: rhodanese-like domain-containing protein [Candidatus Methanoperedens sp.]|nr:rhodanese-like domain-containing protein [Candidatus Methanoperedens sp.]PKL53642.1 MAG: sulfurtransferase [Candidatus Methanoperedenaceae archaeon HGW-Methanoperedenaceae-1]
MRKSYSILLILAAVGLTVLSGCISQPGQKVTPAVTETVKGYGELTAPELEAMMSQEDVFLVDTHIPEQKHIKGTDEVIPFNEIEANLYRLPTDKNSRIVVYCMSGSMGAIASKKLVELGYTDVNNLLGGTIEWRKQGYGFEE